MGRGGSYGRACTYLLDTFVGIFFPSSCVSCGEHMKRNEPVCDTCWANVQPAAEEFCFACGISGMGAVTYYERVACAEAAHRPYRAKAVFVAGSEILSLVHAFKYRRHRFLGDAMGKLMALSLHDSSLPERDSVLLAVPLHRARKRERGFNQSEILAERVSETVGIPVLHGVLERKRLTKSQAELPAERRWLNVRDSFAVKTGALVEGRDIILVDDVVTTGATVSSCAGVLEEVGARSVSVLSFVIA